MMLAEMFLRGYAFLVLQFVDVSFLRENGSRCFGGVEF